MSPGSRIERVRLGESLLSWPNLRRTDEPLPAELVLKSPGFEQFTSHFSYERRSAILDLGSPWERNIDFFSQFPCVLHIADLLRVLADDPAMSTPEEERDLQQVIERAISYDGQVRFDAVLGWNVFDYLDQGDDSCADATGRGVLSFGDPPVHDDLDPRDDP